uniref:Uncharacterized protein n=1 Tax=Pseudomonas phage Aurca01 TaxID=3138527 RepID=A0AAU6W4H2_9VIRU
MLLVCVGAQRFFGFDTAIHVHVATFFGSLLVKLSCQRQVAHFLGLLSHSAQTTKPVRTVGDRNLCCLFAEPLARSVEQFSPVLAKALTGELCGVVGFTLLPGDFNPELCLDRCNYLGWRIKAGQSLNDEGFDLAS